MVLPSVAQTVPSGPAATACDPASRPVVSSVQAVPSNRATPPTVATHTSPFGRGRIDRTSRPSRDVALPSKVVQCCPSYRETDPMYSSEACAFQPTHGRPSLSTAIAPITAAGSGRPGSNVVHDDPLQWSTRPSWVAAHSVPSGASAAAVIAAGAWTTSRKSVPSNQRRVHPFRSQTPPPAAGAMSTVSNAASSPTVQARPDPVAGSRRTRRPPSWRVHRIPEPSATIRP